MSFVSSSYLRPEDIRLNFINILPVVQLGRHFYAICYRPSVCLSVVCLQRWCTLLRRL